MTRPKHPDKNIEAVLQEAEGHGWKVKKGKAYFKALCTCGNGHAKWSIHLTPSNPNYARTCAPGSVARNAGREAEMLFNVAVQVRFIGDLSGLEKLLDVVMEELVKLDVTDPSIGGTLSDGDIEFSLAVEAETLEEATASVFGTIRTAIHAAGGGTPGWPEYRGESVTAQLVVA